MRKKLKWQSIGTVLGETNINEFYFSLKNYQAKKGDIVKVLARGKIDSPVNISAHKFSASAEKMIEKAGGKVSII